MAGEQDVFRAQVAEALHALLTARDWDETHSIFVQRQVVLLSDDALLILQNMIEDLQGKPELVKSTEQYLSLLDDAKTLDIDQAWERLMQKLEKEFEIEAARTLDMFLLCEEIDDLRTMLETQQGELVFALDMLSGRIKHLLDSNATAYADFLATYYHLINDTEANSIAEALQRFEMNWESAFQGAVAEALQAFVHAENWNDLHHRLEVNQGLLLTETALMLLRDKITELRAGDNVVVVDLIETYFDFLNDAQTYGIDVAWQRLLTLQAQVSDAMQELLVALQQGNIQPVLEMKRGILLSHMAFASVQAAISSSSAIGPTFTSLFERLFSILDEIRRTGSLPPDILDRELAAREGREAPAPDFAFPPGFKPGDPQSLAMGQEISGLPGEQQRLLFAFFKELVRIAGSTYEEIQKAAPQINELFTQLSSSITYETTPQLWACLQASWSEIPGKPTEKNELDEMRSNAPYQWALVMVRRGSNRIMAHNEKTESREDIEQAISDFTAALTVFTRSEYPQEWAQALCARGLAYGVRLAGNREENLQQALADFDDALPVLSSKVNAATQALVHMGRGLACLHLADLTGDRGEPIEQAIRDCSAALEIFTLQTDRARWGSVIATRGQAYAQRYAGEQEENRALALADLNAALSTIDRVQTPEEWADCHRSRGMVYLSLMRGDRRENTELALKDFADALSVFTYDADPIEWASVIVGRGMAYQQRQVEDRSRNEELALADFDEALSVFSRDKYPSQWGRTLTARGNLYLLRLGGDKSANLDCAITDYTCALKVFTGHNNPVVGAIYVNRGIARRMIATIDAHTMQQSLVSYSELFTRVVSDEDDYLGKLYEQLIAERQVNAREAMADFDAALQILTIESAPQEWATAHRERATSYALSTPDIADFLHFTASAKQAWNMLTGKAAPEQFNLSPEQIEEAAQHFQQEQKQHTEQAIADYSEALRVFTQQSMPFEWALTLNARGALYLLRVQNGHTEDAKSALDDLDACLSVFTREAAPIYYCNAQYARARVFIKLQRWAQAHIALVRVREVQRDLVAGALRSMSQSDLIAEFSPLDIYLRDAQVLLHLEPPDLDAAVVALEEGRAQSMRAALDLDTIDLEHIYDSATRLRAEHFLSARDAWLQVATPQQGSPSAQQTAKEQLHDDLLDEAHRLFIEARDEIRRYDDPDFMTPIPTKKSIAHAITDSQHALVYLSTGIFDGDDDGMAMIVTRDASAELALQHIRLPRLTREAIADLLADDTTAKIAPIKITRAIETLGMLGLDTLAETLLSRRVTSVRLIPYGWLGLFPLSSAFVSLPGQRKQTLGDLFEVTVVPSARAAEIANSRAARAQERAVELLLGGNPQPRAADNLPYAEAEAEAIYQIATAYSYHVHAIHYLTPYEVTKARVVELLQHVTYAHLAIHGQYKVDTPLASALVLAGGNVIELREALHGAMNMKSLRLLVLSACETSVIDIRRTPDEVVGLAAGFLQAGAAGVIASLWQVNDAASFLLMTRFAELYLNPQRHLLPAQALAQAQYWVREQANNRILASYNPGYLSIMMPGQRKIASEQIARIRERAAHHLQTKPDELPYADPLYWAAYVVTGR